MILNASALNGASSDAGRSMSVGSSSSGQPAIAGTSSGDAGVDDGVEQRLDALFLNAEPQMTGTNARRSCCAPSCSALASAALISSS